MGDGSSDGASAVMFCPHPGAWSTPRVIDEIQEAENAFNPYISPDGLDLYYSSPDGFNTSHRASRSDMFQPLTPIPMQPTFSSARGAFLSDDQQRLWFHECCEYPGPDYTNDVFFARRLGPLQFEPGTHLPLLAMPGNDEDDPGLTSDELTLVISLFINGGYHIALSTRATTNDEFSRPTAPLALGAPGDNAFAPWISGDGHVLYWSKDGKIYWATRTSDSAPWITQGEVQLADGRSDRGDPSLTRDGAVIVYAAANATSGGPTQLLIAERTCN